MNWVKQNYGNIIVVFVLLVLIGYSIILIRRSKGKCANCAKSDTCPFNKRH